MDESVKGDYLVIAGYISSVPKWATFSDEWDALLHHGSGHYPRLDEFHMNEMMRTPERKEMVPWFYRIIERHVDYSLAAIINVTHLRAEFAQFDWPDFVVEREPLLNPYLYAFKLLFQMLRHFGREIGITEKVDFVFDNRAHDDALCLRGWQILCEMNPDFADLCGESPLFRDSKLNMPLQAADLIAYWVREWKERGLEPKTGDLPFPWWKAERDIPTLSGNLSDGDFTRSWTDQLAGTKIHAPTFRRV